SSQASFGTGNISKIPKGLWRLAVQHADISSLLCACFRHEKGYQVRRRSCPVANGTRYDACRILLGVYSWAHAARDNYARSPYLAPPNFSRSSLSTAMAQRRICLLPDYSYHRRSRCKTPEGSLNSVIICPIRISPRGLRVYLCCWKSSER